MESNIVREHFRSPFNRGEMKESHGRGSAGTEACGAEITLFIRFAGSAGGDGPGEAGLEEPVGVRQRHEGTIAAAAFTASGSSAMIAAGSILTQRLRGMGWRRAAAYSREELLAELGCGGPGDGPAESGSAGREPSPGSPRQAAEYAIDALHAALEDSLRRGTFPGAGGIREGAVMVAMSGGVDSATACLLMHRAGREVTGITLRLVDEKDATGEGEGAVAGAASGLSCCSPESIRLARQVCHGLGLPHLTVDLRAEFEQAVVADFVNQYLKGRTPNPCARCNGVFRFPVLVRLAEQLGASRVATGHYARIVEAGGVLRLGRGLDRGKDQSYMLWGIEPALLSRIEFPLGEMEKVDTRETARAAGLAVHDRVDSQDVCFVPGDDYRRFVKERLRADEAAVPGRGEMVDAAGKRLGEHSGYLDYTVGQRRGLGGGSERPLFVLAIDAAANRVVAGSREELAVRSLQIGGVNSFVPESAVGEVGVQLRYRSPALPGRVTQTGDVWRIELDEPAYGVAPGQSAVLYQGDLVAAAGIIGNAIGDVP